MEHMSNCSVASDFRIKLHIWSSAVGRAVIYEIEDSQDISDNLVDCSCCSRSSQHKQC